jgi:ribosomal protein L37E
LFALGHRVTNGIWGGRPAVEGMNFLFKPQQFDHAVCARSSQRIFHGRKSRCRAYTGQSTARRDSGIEWRHRLNNHLREHLARLSRWKRAARVMLKAHRLVFDNKKEVVPFILRFLDQSQEVAERSYELLVASLSRNGEITDQEWEILTEKKRPLEEVRDFTLLREARQELKIR